MLDSFTACQIDIINPRRGVQRTCGVRNEEMKVSEKNPFVRDYLLENRYVIK